MSPRGGFFFKRLGMVSVPCIVDNSNGFFLFYSKSLLKKIPYCFGSFRNSFVCFGCFDKGSKHRNKPKIFFVWFHETNRNKRETDLVSVCFVWNRQILFFISRTPYSGPIPVTLTQLCFVENMKVK